MEHQPPSMDGRNDDDNDGSFAATVTHAMIKEHVAARVSEVIYGPPPNGIVNICGAVCAGCGASVQIAIASNVMERWRASQVRVLVGQHQVNVVNIPDIVVCDPTSGHAFLAIEAFTATRCSARRLTELATTTDGVLELLWEPFVRERIVYLKAPLITVPCQADAEGGEKRPPLCGRSECLNAWTALRKDVPWPTRVASALDVYGDAIPSSTATPATQRNRLILHCMRTVLRFGSEAGKHLAPYLDYQQQQQHHFTLASAELFRRQMFLTTHRRLSAVAPAAAPPAPPHPPTPPPAGRDGSGRGSNNSRDSRAIKLLQWLSEHPPISEHMSKELASALAVKLQCTPKQLRRTHCYLRSRKVITTNPTNNNTTP